MKQLRFSTTAPMGFFGILNSDEEKNKPLVLPKTVDELIHDKVRGRTAYIHGEAENLARFDIPQFIDGNMGQLDLPVDEQDILMLLPCGEYPCKAEYNDSFGAQDCYLITLKTEPSVHK